MIYIIVICIYIYKTGLCIVYKNNVPPWDKSYIFYKSIFQRSSSVSTIYQAHLLALLFNCYSQSEHHKTPYAIRCVRTADGGGRFWEPDGFYGEWGTCCKWIEWEIVCDDIFMDEWCTCVSYNWLILDFFSNMLSIIVLHTMPLSKLVFIPPFIVAESDNMTLETWIR